MTSVTSPPPAALRVDPVPAGVLDGELDAALDAVLDGELDAALDAMLDGELAAALVDGVGPPLCAGVAAEPQAVSVNAAAVSARAARRPRHRRVEYVMGCLPEGQHG
ncbi:hypothetical protein ABLG96_16710 [Nakamurella sp. A5-74]|uniref:Uncharacterized protein n=1 Tax=Nakamurella sp. A5-74 TaxID=3158264 RepID=A0AAU8DL37_9ACTN